MTDLQEQFNEVLKTKWRPDWKFVKKSYDKRRYKALQAFGKTNKRKPVFTVNLQQGKWFDGDGKDCVEATKWHAGGIGSSWSFSVEAIDKFVIMLLVARKRLVDAQSGNAKAKVGMRK